MTSRRAVLLGLGASAAAPLLGAGPSPLRRALDQAATLPPADALALLAPLRPATLRERLDWETARAGLAADVALAALGIADPKRASTAGPQGQAIYDALLRRQIGDRIDAAAAERRLERARDALSARAARLFAAIGDTRGSIGERYTRLWQDERWLYADDAAGRTEAVADMNRVLAGIRARLAPASACATCADAGSADAGGAGAARHDGGRSLFPSLPPDVLAVAAERMSAADEAAGRGGFRELPSPGQRGRYVVDLKAIRRRPRWSLPSVVAHELLPGHMIQLPLEAAADPHPLRLAYAPGFGEGWATYAEALAFARGWLGSDPRVALGHVHWLLFRAHRALADIAVHHHRRAPETVRAAIVAAQGEPVAFITIDADLARIAREPGTRVAEAMAWLALADAAPGNDAALARFHRAALVDGRRRSDRIAALAG